MPGNGVSIALSRESSGKELLCRYFSMCLLRFIYMLFRTQTTFLMWPSLQVGTMGLVLPATGSKFWQAIEESTILTAHVQQVLRTSSQICTHFALSVICRAEISLEEWGQCALHAGPSFTTVPVWRCLTSSFIMADLRVNDHSLWRSTTER